MEEPVGRPKRKLEVIIKGILNGIRSFGMSSSALASNQLRYRVNIKIYFGFLKRRKIS
jgi:hypothetical protein